MAGGAVGKRPGSAAVQRLSAGLAGRTVDVGLGADGVLSREPPAAAIGDSVPSTRSAAGVGNAGRSEAAGSHQDRVGRHGSRGTPGRPPCGYRRLLWTTG